MSSDQEKIIIKTDQSIGIAESLIGLHPSSPTFRSIARTVLTVLLFLLLAAVVGFGIYKLFHLIFMIVLSVFFAYLIDPLVKLIRKPFKAKNAVKYMPRPLAILIAYAVVLGVLVWIGSNIAPRLVEQGKEFSSNWPTYYAQLQNLANDVSNRFQRLRLPEEFVSEINGKIGELGSSISSSLGETVLTFATYLPWFILVPVLAFFFLKDVNLFRLGVLRAFPVGPLRMRAEAIMHDINLTLAAYIRAQLTSCVVIGLVCTAAFYLLGIKYALMLGVVAGVCEFVPVIGPLLIGLTVVCVSAVTNDVRTAASVLIFLVILRIFQDYVIYPRIVRGGIHLSPLAIILSVLAGEQLAGIPGVFISIPVVAIATVIYRHVLEHRGSRTLIAGLVAESDNLTVPENNL